MPLISVDLPEDLSRFIESEVQLGHYTTTGEVVLSAVFQFKQLVEAEAHLTELDPGYKASLEALNAALEEGEQSGVVEHDVFAEAREHIRQFSGSEHRRAAS